MLPIRLGENVLTNGAVTENKYGDSSDYLWYMTKVFINEKKNYGSVKCLTGCGTGKLSQRFYHVPRSFLIDDTNNNINTLVLFEEMCGSPYDVSVQTTTTSSICATADYGNWS
ncbi:hypothetical protein TSUD_151770 [Trifolium subterraneum]|uniref:Uncharacterized protein n=1 Tax=Trifolium subterraneum TaxID=3900 RepID=A0A2Z6N0Z6_TRISU|nr:hypothetical protein TSUD_151770 [Trifolium subterraneum]